MAKCCAPHCSNNKNRDYNQFTFHVFPKNPALREEWVKRIGRPNWVPGRRSLLCSAHFRESVFDRTGQMVRLRDGAIPTIFCKLSKGRGPQRLIQYKEEGTEEVPFINDESVYLDGYLEEPKVEYKIVIEDGMLPNDIMMVSEEDGFVNEDSNLISTSAMEVLSNDTETEENLSSTKEQEGTWICRLCGIASNNTIDLFCEEAVSRKLLERIHTTIPIRIVKGDGLPHSVCRNCNSKLDEYSQLICTSLNTHKQLLSVFQDSENESLIRRKNLETQHSSHSDRKKKTRKKKVLLMEMPYEEEKSMEYHLAVAAEELTLRLQPQEVRHREPNCKMVIVTMCDESKMPYGEQMSKAVEVLLSKQQLSNVPVSPERAAQMHIVQHKMQSVHQFPHLQSIVKTVCHEQSKLTLATDVKDSTISKTFDVDEDQEREDELGGDLPGSVQAEFPESGWKLQPLIVTEYPPDMPHAQPIVDDITPLQFENRNIRKPKLDSAWQSRGFAATNLQKIFEWQETESGDLQPVCRLCGFIITNNHDDPQVHIEKHADLCCHVCLGIFSTQIEKEHHLCDPKAAPKALRQVQNSNTWKSLKRKRLDTWFQCSLCDVRVKQKASLEQHLQQHYQSQAKCKACGFKAADLQEVLTHRQSCAVLNKQTEWQCRKCMEVMESEDALKAHISEFGHENIPGWLCDICGKRFKPGANITQHKRTHLPAEFAYIHQCPHCPKRYNTPAKMREHMQKHEGKRYMCKECGKLFGTKQILRQHELTHGEPQYECTICNRMFHRKSHVRNHMTVHKPGYRKKTIGEVNRKDGLYRCRECNVVPEGDLVGHYRNMHPDKDLSCYTCSICQEPNTSYSALFQHQRHIHKMGGNKCMFCGKIIESSTILKYHMMKHEGMAPYTCPDDGCGKGYYSNTMLQDHMRRKHTGEKPFQCKNCPKRFATNGALIQHNTVHFQPHELIPCQFCGQGFKRKAHLDIHLRTHTGEKPYPCPICERPFRQRPDCLKHVRVIHGQDPAKFKVQFVPNTGIAGDSGLNVVSVTEMELVLEGEDLMQATLQNSSECVKEEEEEASSL